MFLFCFVAYRFLACRVLVYRFLAYRFLAYRFLGIPFFSIPGFICKPDSILNTPDKPPLEANMICHIGDSY